VRRERASAPKADAAHTAAAAPAKGAPAEAAAEPQTAPIVVGPLEQPGIYHVLLAPEGGGASREDPALAFAAHADARESDLRRVDEAEIKAQLGGAGSAQVAASASAAEGARGTPLWGGLLLLGVLALLGEGALTRK
jgi:hypothetical protein